jgi:hypothetical protein
MSFGVATYPSGAQKIMACRPFYEVDIFQKLEPMSISAAC